MSRLYYLALFSICLLVSYVKSQPTIADNDIGCFDTDLEQQQQQHSHHLKQLMETERHLIQELRDRVAILDKGDTAIIGNVSLLKTLNYPSCNNGVTYSEGKIYTLQDTPKSLHVYDDREPFALQKIIPIEEVKDPEDMAYSRISNCLYITDKGERCIWKIDLSNDDRVTRWLPLITEPFRLSLSAEGHVVILKDINSVSHLEIYGSDAVLLHRFQLPDEIRQPQHAIQTHAGDFIITHSMGVSSSQKRVISKLPRNMQALITYIPMGPLLTFFDPCHLAYDYINNRLLVLDISGDKVTVLDADFRWGRALLLKETHGLSAPTRLSYDPQNSHLIVGQWCNGTKVFKINQGIN